MVKIVFCVFILIPLILDVNVQFSEKVRISPEAPRGEIWAMCQSFSIAFLAEIIPQQGQRTKRVGCTQHVPRG